MKRAIFAMEALAFLLFASTADARERSLQPIRVDLTVYGAYALADAPGFGIGAVIEPKYDLTDHLALGLRLEGCDFVSRAVVVADSVGASHSESALAIMAYLAKADYFLTTSSVRPFVGLGLGLYQIFWVPETRSSDGSTQRAKSFFGFGFSPQLGVNLGRLRMAATYHFVTGEGEVAVTPSMTETGTMETKLARSFLAFEIGGTFGGGRRAPKDNEERPAP